jgi:hypothetical protein
LQCARLDTCRLTLEQLIVEQVGSVAIRILA